MKRYAKGARFERWIILQLRKRGWYAYRFAGSKGPFDLIAWAPGVGARLIQAASGRGKGRAAMLALSQIPLPLHAVAEVWHRSYGHSLVVMRMSEGSWIAVDPWITP